MVIKTEYFIREESKAIVSKDLEGLDASLHSMYVHYYDLKLNLHNNVYKQIEVKYDPDDFSKGSQRVRF